MQLTKQTDFALRLLMLLSEHPEQRIPASAAARELDVSWHHLRKIVARLVRLGYVQSSRGRHGGLLLARAPEAIIIGQVVRDLEPTLRPVNCLEPRCPLLRRCRLKSMLGEAMEGFLSHLDGFTLAQSLDNPVDSGSPPARAHSPG
ncbi:RrF2 family transcriptional regulator [Natronospira bacteriovora]|uniref:Rrf2 family transcriptional regulator n=1 Tax=Natronospira bacteriovora TaxID=3069753 RepID=A0ABU0W3I9_9GAMM|nr:Rrf2 family transcriptional regulator [Natronospira sp. AB-CW4]MDQ2068587.1 Rrf2 family transcriptional regulator [Natronospira sp. AB-CW4]